MISTKTAKDVEVISSWPGSLIHTEEKVPSRLAYANENGFDIDKWGYAVESGMTIVQWFKLLLDSNTEKTDYDDPLLADSLGSGLMHLPAGKDALQVASDFLTYLREYAMEQLKNMTLQTAIEQTAIRVQVTTPATWSYSAREATRQAVKNAGFGSGERDEIVLIDEPEAAALWAIRSTQNNFPENKFEVRAMSTLISPSLVDSRAGEHPFCYRQTLVEEPSIS